MPFGHTAHLLLLPLLLAAIAPCLAQVSLGGCCEDATCSTCEEISVCQNLPGVSPETAFAGGLENCGLELPDMPCSTWWENNIAGVTNDAPVSPTNPGGCLTVCSDPDACNYASLADCDYTDCPGCTDILACNFNPLAITDNGSCEYLTCAGVAVLYFEDFENYPDNYGLWNGGNTPAYDGTETNWSINGNPITLIGEDDYFMVDSVNGSNKFAGRNLDGEFIWTSKEVDVVGYDNLDLSVTLSEAGGMESTDYIKLFYVKDDETEILIDEIFDDFGSTTVTESSFQPTTSLRIRLKIQNNAAGEIHRFDNILLQAADCGNSESDVDGDGICDFSDNCTNTSACNFNGSLHGNETCQLPEGCDTCSEGLIVNGDNDGDTICDDADNCSDTIALNYDDIANEVCVFQVFYEPFTDDSQFTKNVAFSHDGTSDFWGIYDPDGNEDDFDGNSGQPSGIGSFDGVDGNFLVGEDMNAAPVIADPGILTWSNIDISTYEAALTFELDIAEIGATGDEFVELYAKLPTDGSWTLLIDPGLDLNNFGSTLTKQTVIGNFDGTSLDIQLRMYSDDPGDELAVDDLRVLGTSSCVAVTVSADAPTVSLDGNGTVSVSAGENGAEVTVSSSGDCFTVTGYQVSKSSASSDFGDSVSFDCTETGAQTVWIRATNGSQFGPATATTIAILDAQPPFVNSTSQGTLSLGEDGMTELLAGPEFASSTDNCATDILASLVPDGPFFPSLSFDCSNIGTQGVYFLAQDESGNQSEVVGPVSFVIQDVLSPDVSIPSGSFLVGASGPSSNPISIGFQALLGASGSCSDNCTAEANLFKQASKTGDDWDIAGAELSFDCSDIGEQTVYVKATDESGNSTVVAGTIAIIDNQIPGTPQMVNGSFTLNDGTVQVTTSDLMITANDNCTNSDNLLIEISRNAVAWGTGVSFGCSDATGQSWPIYVRATDASNNTSANGVGYVTINDDPNILAFAQDITVALDPSGLYSLAAFEVDNGSVGNCYSALSVSPSQFDCDDLGSNLVTLTISDGTYTSSTTATVTIEDVTAPNATPIPGGTLSIDLDNSGNGIIFPEDVFIAGNPIDWCTADEDLAIEIKRADGPWENLLTVDCSDIGTDFEVDVRITDESGNAWLMSLNGFGPVTVTVLDVTPPLLGPITSGSTESLSGLGTSLIAASDYFAASDECSGPQTLEYQISESSNQGFASSFEANCEDVGAKLFYFRSIDASGNISAEGSSLVYVVDDTPPAAIANSIELFTTGNGSVELAASNPQFNASADNCTIISAQIRLTEGTGSFTDAIAFSETGTYGVTLRITDSNGLSAFASTAVTISNNPISGCMALNACNYDPAANQDDGSCQYPGNTCQAPAAGFGYVYAIDENQCICVPDPFVKVYFEDFGPGGAAGGQGTGYGYQGYRDIDGDGINDENNALLETEWTLSSDDPAVGDGILDGTEADYWCTLNVLDANGSVSDTVFDGLYLGSRYTWTTRGIFSQGFEFVHIQSELTEDGVLEPDDYIRLKLIEDGTVSNAPLGEIVDDAPNPFPSYTSVDTTLEIASDVIQLQVEAFNDADGEYHTFDDVAVSLWGIGGCKDPLATNFDADADVDDGTCLFQFAPAYSRYSGTFDTPLWAPAPCDGPCPVPDLYARALPVLEQLADTPFDFVITQGTTLTASGIVSSADGLWQELYVRNLILEAGSALHIPEGHRLVVMGDFNGVSEDQIQGEGQICLQGDEALFTDNPGLVSIPTPYCALASEFGCASDNDGDGVCDEDELQGCTDGATPACNFDPLATDDDGSCEYLSCVDGVNGCTYPTACNFNASATADDGTCTFAATGLDCNGDCLLDADQDGTCDGNEIPGCTDPLAINHHPSATEDDGSCQYDGPDACPQDVNDDNVIGVADILEVLASFGASCN